MQCICFLSTDNLDDFFVYDELLIPAFRARGCDVETVSWHADNVNWQKYDMVIVRSTWDYQQQPDAFIRTLAVINKQTTLQNPFDLMRWNLDKSYLIDLQEAGVPTLPTTWASTFDRPQLLAQFEEFETAKLVVKPTVSANADDTFVVTRKTFNEQIKALSACFRQRPYMIQPFIDAIVQEGEYSLFYFGGTLSHAILKKPAEGDFRVQEEHGGSLKVVAAQPEMQAVCEQVLGALPQRALYARIDIVRFAHKWCIIEVELIEPSLYFNLDSQSPQRFVEAVFAL
ncbi:ATP-grasp domain-containing protein [Salinimonas chungwhensis]|uniref:ATP-grasp domain-containing protein n=1 Tax=Salinimonas chungwhensis TaxID=265425 RepID=UPI0003708534|nr:hypothetical protein [Salinimonas chungwhensis]